MKYLINCSCAITYQMEVEANNTDEAIEKAKSIDVNGTIVEKKMFLPRIERIGEYAS